MGKGKRRLKKRLKRVKRQNRRKKQNKGKHPGRDKHHLTAKAFNGPTIKSNLLLIDIEKHRCWHRLFGLRNLRQVIELLERVERMKGKQKP